MALPKGFIRVEYIESNGTQYVDTGFMPNQNTQIVVDFESGGVPADYNGSLASLFGARNSASSNAFAVWIKDDNAYPQYGNVNYSGNGSISENTVARLQYNLNKNVFTVASQTLECGSATISTNYPAYILTLNSAGKAETRRAVGKLYSCQIYDDGTLVRDYIPCLNESGEAGLYDLVNDVFYGNAGTGSFIAGPEIQTGPEAPAELAYTVSGERISLSWSPSEGADGYRVYMDGARVLETTETAAELPFPPFTEVTLGVSAYNTDGESAQTTAAVANYPENPILYLVTDRTPADVERVKQLAAKDYASMTEAERNEWNAGLKGAYNASDLNRVQAAMAYLADRLNALGYYAEAPHQRAWTASDMPKPSDMAAYLSDVEKLRAVIPVMLTTPDAPPDAEKLTYSEANNIEKILLDINTLLNNMTAAWFYSGELYSGEV